MAGRPQKRTEQTRTAILDAARGAFDAGGYDATSVEAIAARAGVAKATVFAHFADKASLLIAVRIDALHAQMATMHAAVAAGPPAGETAGHAPHDGRAHAFLIALFRPWLALYRADPEFTRLFLSQTTLKDGPWTRQFLEICGAMETDTQAAFTRLQAQRLIPPDTDPALLAQGVLAFFYHMLVGQTVGACQDPDAQDAVFADLLAVWLRGVCTPVPRSGNDAAPSAAR